MRIVILGATGTLGKALVAAAASHDVVAVSRHGQVRADVTTGEGLREALAGADVVIDATNALPTAADAVLVGGTRRVIETCAAVGVKHFVGTSIVGIDDSPLPYYRTKVAQEQVITAGGVPWTIQRATQFHSLIPRFATPRLGIVAAPHRWPLQPIDERDVAPVMIAAAIAGPAARLPDLGGPEVIPFVELARAWLRASGRRGLVLPVPVPGARGRFLRSGALTTPDRTIGTITFAQWLRETYPAPAR